MKKFFKIFFIALVVVLSGVYFAGVGIFHQYTLANTYINNKDFSFVKKDQIKDQYEKKMKNLQVTVLGRHDLKDVFKAQDIDYYEKLTGKADLKQNPWAWPVLFFSHKNYKLDSELIYNDRVLNQRIASSPFVTDPTATDPKDAYVTYKQGKGFVIEPEVQGTKVAPEKLKNEVLQALKNEKPKLDLNKENVYHDPKVTKDSPYLKNQLASLAKISSINVVYDFEDRKEELNGEKLLALYTDDGQGNLNPDPEKVKAYVADLAKKYDTYRGTRTFYATGGQAVTVQGGIYGWRTDQAKTGEELLKLLNEGQSKTLKPVYSQEAMSRTQNDIGSNYVEIDLTRHHMWVYKNAQLMVDTPIVTGNPNKGNATPTGVGRVWSKERDRYLTGDTYKSYVRYWIPYTWVGVGIHDSSWRSSYGGKIYQAGGSHGCINTPPKNMPKVYENIDYGTPVVVYKS